MKDTTHLALTYQEKFRFGLDGREAMRGGGETLGPDEMSPRPRPLAREGQGWLLLHRLPSLFWREK